MAEIFMKQICIHRPEPGPDLTWPALSLTQIPGGWTWLILYLGFLAIGIWQEWGSTMYLCQFSHDVLVLVLRLPWLISPTEDRLWVTRQDDCILNLASSEVRPGRPESPRASPALVHTAHRAAFSDRLGTNHRPPLSETQCGSWPIRAECCRLTAGRARLG